MKTASEWISEAEVKTTYGVEFDADDVIDIQRDALESAAKAVWNILHEDADCDLTITELQIQATLLRLIADLETPNENGEGIRATNFWHDCPG